ncbi:MAG: PaaI family thioesterase [Bacteroidia bacterium]
MSESLIEQYISQNQFGKYLGMQFEIIAPGEVNYYLKIEEKHLATPSAAHGGAISALADAALGVCGLSAVHTDNKVVSTVEYKIHFLSPALLNDKLKAVAKVIKKGNRLMTIECDIFCENRNNLLISKSIGTFNAYDAIKAGYKLN